jgi:ABC-type antimicrobial peptide transport system permease subunit
MLFNYLKVALRNLFKNKIYILINIAGMGIALAFCLTIYLLYAYNAEFDDFYKDTGNIVRVHEFKQDASGEIQRFELAPIAMGPRVPAEIAGVADQTRFINWGGIIKYEDDLLWQSVAYVDSNFFDFFEMKLKSGSKSSIQDKNSIFITPDCAKRFFGDEPAMGKILTLNFPGKKSIDLTVAGVFEQIPLNTSFIFEALTNIDHFLYGNDIQPDDWTPWQQASLYLKLDEGADMKTVEEQLSRYVTIQNDARDEWKISDLKLVGFQDAKILNQGEITGSNANFRIRDDVLLVFTTLAILILLIACFNLANTSMALMANRGREIGVRKVMGGGTLQVFFQFLLEMSFTSLLAIIVGMAIFNWLADWFYSIWNAPIHFTYFSKLNFLVAFILLFVFTTLISGLYPALYSKRFNPSDIFRNQVKLKGSGITSRILNAMQFAISITMLVAGIVFSQNADFLKSLDVGYRTEGLIVVYFNDSDELNQIRDKVQSRADVTGYTGTNDHFGNSYEDTNLILDTGNIEIRSYRVGDKYLNSMGVKLLEGRFFYKDNTNDLEEAIIVNEEYLRKFNIKDPIGKMVNLASGKRYIVGVIQDIIWNVFNDAILVPEVYLPVSEEEYQILVVQADPENEQQVFEYLEETWKAIIPDRPFSGNFQYDIAIGYAMQDNENMQQIFFALAVLGSLLSLTGIFALSSLNVSRRFKEIGIRKVMGASSQRILMQLNKGFFWTLILASVAGAFLGYFHIQISHRGRNWHIDYREPFSVDRGVVYHHDDYFIGRQYKPGLYTQG